MESAQQIRINELLLEREALFLRIHALETKAAALLGEPYPFVRPTLPSDYRAKKKAGRPRATGGHSADSSSTPVRTVTLRSLEESEAAYRVVYEQLGRREEELHFDVGALGHLLACQGATLRVCSLEIVDEAGRVLETLLAEEAAKPAADGAL